MFSIDLLKGKGIPKKVNLRRTMFKAVPLLIPVIAVVAWAASYQNDCVRLKNQMGKIQKNQITIDNSSLAVKAYCQMNSQLTEMRKKLETITNNFLRLS